MTQVTYVEPEGRELTLELEPGVSLMRGALDAGVAGVEAQCGGNCSCATCHCYVDPAWLDRLPAPSQDEEQMLQNVAAPRRANSRLSCQLIAAAALQGIRVQFPDRQT